MSSMRRMISSLCIIALLLGNVAGFVHLGCIGESEHHHCSHLVEELAHQHQDAHFHQHAGCDHHHANDQPTSNKRDSQNSGEKHQHPNGHDKDSCHLCQSVYTSKDCIFVTDSCCSLTHELSIDRVFAINAPKACEAFARCNPVRGPPQA